jgi:hypothetical protein
MQSSTFVVCIEYRLLRSFEFNNILCGVSLAISAYQMHTGECSSNCIMRGSLIVLEVALCSACFTSFQVGVVSSLGQDRRKGRRRFSY